MRFRGLLSFAIAVLLTGCVGVLTGTGRSPDIDQTPKLSIDAGTVPLTSSGDGITLLLRGVLNRERFALEQVEAVGSRLASRSPDPDQFRIVRYNSTGEVLDTVHLWSPLDRFEWDSAGQRERRVSVVEARVEIPVPVYIGVAGIELQWPGGARLGRIDVSSALQTFCAKSPVNPGCRR